MVGSGRAWPEGRRGRSSSGAGMAGAGLPVDPGKRRGQGRGRQVGDPVSIPALPVTRSEASLTCISFPRSTISAEILGANVLS